MVTRMQRPDSRPLARALIGVVLLVGCSLAAEGQPRTPPTGPRTGTLVIAGDVDKPLTLTPEQVKMLPRASVTIEEDGRPVKYDGVLMGELLKMAGAPVGQNMRGNAVSSYVLATGNDGYSAVFSIAELDPVFTRSQIIVADSADGKALFDYQGPFRIIAPQDTRAARSVRMLEKIELVRVKK
jgi:hypothetical protein